MDTNASSPVKPTQSQKGPTRIYFLINIIAVILIVIVALFVINKCRSNAIEKEEEVVITEKGDVSHQAFSAILKLFVVWLLIMIILYVINKITKARSRRF